MSVTKITDHQAAALLRLLEQYKNRPRLKSIFDAFNIQIQETEDAIFDLIQARQLDFATGQQLDELGEIVGQERLDFEDDFYRILILAKIGINISQGDPERLISVWKLMTEANFVHLSDAGLGSVLLGSPGTIDPTLVNFIFANIQKVPSAGVRVDFIWCFDEDEGFSFDGATPGTGLGFGDDTDPLVGGKFGFLHKPTVPLFSFANTVEDNDAGFSDLGDLLVGGLFV